MLFILQNNSIIDTITILIDIETIKFVSLRFLGFV